MPKRNRTGPAGDGPRTGRGAGNCAGEGGTLRFGSRGFSRGKRRRGFGRNFRYAPKQHHSCLQDQVKSLKSAIQSITEQLEAMKKE